MKLLLVVLGVFGITGLASGSILLIDPSGKSFGADLILPYLRQHLPFIHDFTIVGSYLLIIYGLLPFALVFALWKRSRAGWWLSVLLGFTVVAWILVEIAMFYSAGFTPMYPMIGGVGILIIGLSLLSSTRQFFGAH